MKHIAIAAILFMVLSASRPAEGQIMVCTMDAGAIEIGYGYQWFRRDLEPIVPPENNWEIADVFIRYGAFERLTLFLDGGVWELEHRDFPGQSYRRYTIGAGVGIRLIDIGKYRMNLSFHFNELLDIDKAEYDFHKRIRNISACLYVERHFPVMEQTVGIYGGVLYSDVRGETYPWGSPPPVTGESENNFGLDVGASLLIADHFKPFAHFIFVEYAQARVGFALQLR